MARMIHTGTQPQPDIMRATVRTFPFADPDLIRMREEHLGDNPLTATEKMWWRSTGSLAYNTGQQYPEAETGQLIGDALFQHELRFGPGTEPQPYLGPAGKPVVAADVEDEPVRRGPGRPRKMRDL